MDFHTLARRDLQALCKKNKIPANITNVAMAEALKALQIVEGLEEFMESSQSGTAQSSTESLDMLDITSPFVPTAGRSTRRTKVATLEPESVNPMTRTRRTTRKTQVEDADATETPALVARSNRKKGQMASACRKMDSQLKECADEGKKDFLLTPAPMGGTTRRRRVGESAVNRVYSTRRSTRLAEKKTAEVSNEENLVTKVGENEGMELKYGQDNLDELSGITDVDAITTMEGKSENKDEYEVVSDQKKDMPIENDESEIVSDQNQDTSIGKEQSDVSVDQKQDDASVGKDESEVVSDQELDGSNGKEVELDSNAGEEEAILKEEKCDNEVVPLTVSNEVQQNDGSQDVCISEIEVMVEKKTEELKTEGGEEASHDEAPDCVENVTLESGDNFVIDESSCNNAGSQDEIEKEHFDGMAGNSKDVPDFDVTMVKLAEFTLQQADHLDTRVQNKNEAGENEILPLEEIKTAADPVPSDESYAEADSDVIDSLDIPAQLNDNEAGKIEILPLEESEKVADSVASDEPYAEADSDFNDQLDFPVQLNENEPNDIEVTQHEVSEKDADLVPSDEPPYADFSEQLPKSEVDVETSHLIAQPICSTPSKNSARKASLTMKSRTCFSDNKENIGSGGKLVIMKDVKMATKSVENADNLHQLSVRKLSKMLKEKLETTKKPSKNENGNEVMSRPALQVLPENQLVDETQN